MKIPAVCTSCHSSPKFHFGFLRSLSPILCIACIPAKERSFIGLNMINKFPKRDWIWIILVVPITLTIFPPSIKEKCVYIYIYISVSINESHLYQDVRKVSLMPGASGWSLHFWGSFASRKRIIDAAPSAPSFPCNSEIDSQSRVSTLTFPCFSLISTNSSVLRQSSSAVTHCSKSSWSSPCLGIKG